MAKLRGAKKAAQDMRKRAALFSGSPPDMFTAVGDEIANNIAENFDKEGWILPWKKRGYGGWPVLDDTGLMRDTSEQSAHTWEHRKGFHANRILTTPYSIYHQYKSILPLRPFIWLSSAHLQRIYDIFSKAFLKGK